MGRKVIDLTGQKFGKLTVLLRVENMGTQPTWLCKCECDNTTEVQGGNLKNGHTTSCGCFNKEISTTQACGIHVNIRLIIILKLVAIIKTISIITTMVVAELLFAMNGWIVLTRFLKIWVKDQMVCQLIELIIIKDIQKRIANGQLVKNKQIIDGI